MLIVFLGELLFFVWLIFSATGRFSIGGPFHELVGYFRGDPKEFWSILFFTGLGCTVAVINCREGKRKRKRGKASPENGG